MRITERDRRLLRDMALSHVLSRDQIIALNYFGSVTRTNTRLRQLRSERIVRTIATPFFAQHLYSVGPQAPSLLNERISSLVAARTGSPRFLQHALCVTNVRIALLKRGATAWRFEQQAHSVFEWQGQSLEVRPDGLALFGDRITAVEVDLGHVAPAKFREKLLALDTFLACGSCQRQWKVEGCKLLVVTTGKLRARRLERLIPPQCKFDYAFVPHDQLGIPFAGAWS